LEKLLVKTIERLPAMLFFEQSNSNLAGWQAG
jgi:hypothetical protein